MFSHIKGFYVRTFLRINHYDKWNEGGMWIYFIFFLRFWTCNLCGSWISSRRRSLFMSICGRWMCVIGKLNTWPFLTSFLCIICLRILFCSDDNTLDASSILVSNDFLRHLLSWSSQTLTSLSPSFLRALSEWQPFWVVVFMLMVRLPVDSHALEWMVLVWLSYC